MTNHITLDEVGPCVGWSAPKIITVIILALFSGSCVGTPDMMAELTPIRELTTRPVQYFDQVVTIQGYLTAEFENYNIWEDAQAEDQYNCKRGVGASPLIDIPRFNRKTVRITGTFRTWCPEDYAPDVGPDDDKCISTGSCGDTEIRFSRIQEVE